jgi:hypothetical protein
MLVEPDRSGADGRGNVGKTPPKAPIGEVVEVEVPIKLGGPFVDGVDDDRSGADLASSPDAPPEGVDEEVTAETPSLLGLVDGEPGQEHDGDGIGHSPPKPGGRADDGARRQRVVADDPVASAEHIGRRGTGRAGDPSGVTQPAVEVVDAGDELVKVVGNGKPFDRPECPWAHRDGIGLGSAA